MSSNRELLMQLYERLQSGLSEPDAYDCLLEIAEGNNDTGIELKVH